MIGINTNVLVRYLTGDDPRQSSAADKFLQKACSAKTPGWIGVIVICELVWVLQRGYGYPRGQIAEVIAQLLRTAEFEVEDKECVRAALKDYLSGNADIADGLIARRNSKAGAVDTYTFDKRAAKLPGFKLLTG